MKSAAALLLLGIIRPDPETMRRLEGPFGEYRPPEGRVLVVTTAAVEPGATVDLSEIVLERGEDLLTPVAVGRRGAWLYPAMVGARPERLEGLALRRDASGRVLLEADGGRVSFAFAAPEGVSNGWSLRVASR